MRLARSLTGTRRQIASARQWWPHEVAAIQAAYRRADAAIPPMIRQAIEVGSHALHFGADAATVAGTLQLLLETGVDEREAIFHAASCLLGARKELRAAIVLPFVRALYVDWWAAERERAIADGRRVPPLEAGVDLLDQAPRTPSRAHRTALAILRRVEQLNREPIEESLVRAVAERPAAHERPPTPGDFGHLVAMQSIGHGIGWDDYHPDFGLELPSAEFYL
jgi:hypothetical protein